MADNRLKIKQIRFAALFVQINDLRVKQCFLGECVALLDDLQAALHWRTAHHNDHAAAIVQRLQQCFGHFAQRSAHINGIIPFALRRQSVFGLVLDIVETQLLQSGLGACLLAAVGIERAHAAGQCGQNGGGITRTGAHFQNTVGFGQG